MGGLKFYGVNIYGYSNLSLRGGGGEIMKVCFKCSIQELF